MKFCKIIFFFFFLLQIGCSSQTIENIEKPDTLTAACKENAENFYKATPAPDKNLIVSFSKDVLPIFEKVLVKGVATCASCHYPENEKKAGNLALIGNNKDKDLVFNEITIEKSLDPTLDEKWNYRPKTSDIRINCKDPYNSLLLTEPNTGWAGTTSQHPPEVQAFFGVNDPNYMKIVYWIIQGAYNN